LRLMADPKQVPNRDRRESNLLLNVVFAHMAFSSAKNGEDRKKTHLRFKDAVRTLHQFMETESPDDGADRPEP
jgi:hypothetical protein